MLFAPPHSTSLTQTIFQAQSLFCLRLCLGLSETETLKDCVTVSVFHPYPDTSPVSLYLVLRPAPTLTGLLCKSVPPGTAESWFHVVTALVQKCCIAWGIKHARTDGIVGEHCFYNPSNWKLQFLEDRSGAGSWRSKEHIPKSATTQVLNFTFAQRARYRTFKEKDHRYFLTWKKAYFTGFILKTTT